MQVGRIAINPRRHVPAQQPVVYPSSWVHSIKLQGRERKPAHEIASLAGAAERPVPMLQANPPLTCVCHPLATRSHRSIRNISAGTVS